MGALTPDLPRLPETFVSDETLADAIARAVQAGKVRRLGPGVYTNNMKDPLERIVQRNLWFLIASLLPGALIADRTALENRPAADGSVFVISGHKRDIELPGLILRPRKGPAPLETDLSFLPNLYISSPARALLENMRPSRARKGVARTFNRREMEERLDEMLRQPGGEATVQRLRDEARRMAVPLDMQPEFQLLDSLIGTLLGTRQAMLESPSAMARAAGPPYDPARLELFHRLHAELAGTAPALRIARVNDGPALPFFEAYFSNFIEGTEFAVEEAEAIVFGGRIPQSRPEDAHDILGTWKVASDEREMTRRPRGFDELIEILKGRHALVMEGRPGKGPGRFKTAANRAGSTVFVAPELVRGTLLKGYELYRGLSNPLHRAVFMMFLVAEVHPFSDGNGRTARLMMNAELVAAGESRILIPTIYRNTYLMAQRALSQNGNAAALLRVMDFAQKYTAAVDFSSLAGARALLEQTNAFLDSNEAEATGVRLRLPEIGDAG
ncbi:MAG: Fic family protein [Bryobacterales bacterium]|nr:Fic family protein [Bryobacterales bacterium]